MLLLNIRRAWVSSGAPTDAAFRGHCQASLAPVNFRTSCGNLGFYCVQPGEALHDDLGLAGPGQRDDLQMRAAVQHRRTRVALKLRRSGSGQATLRLSRRQASASRVDSFTVEAVRLTKSSSALISVGSSRFEHLTIAIVRPCRGSSRRSM
jgi:hypothetical protein